MVPPGSQWSGSPDRSEVGSAIFDPLTAGLRRFCRTDGTRWHAISARLWKGHFAWRWLFCWLWRVEIFSKKLDYQSGRPDLNRRPLDPQSRSGRRWGGSVSLSGDLTSLDSRLASLGVA